MARPAIITVDDDAPVSAAIARDLRARYGADHRILRASSGAEALDLVARLVLRGQPLALVASDQRMPGMSGIELAPARARRRAGREAVAPHGLRRHRRCDLGDQRHRARTAGMIFSPKMGSERLVVGVPDGDARVIPVVAHPLAVFAIISAASKCTWFPAPCQLCRSTRSIRSGSAGRPRRRCRTSGRAPDRCRSGRLFQCICLGMSTSSLRTHCSSHGRPPRFRVFEEAVQRDVGAAQEIRAGR